MASCHLSSGLIRSAAAVLSPFISLQSDEIVCVSLRRLWKRSARQFRDGLLRCVRIRRHTNADIYKKLSAGKFMKIFH